MYLQSQRHWYHPDKTVPDAALKRRIGYQRAIFVFGSNLSSRHGAGAARVAMDSFGAKYGTAVGMCGDSYAIPTKNDTPDLKSAQAIIPLEKVQCFVRDFVVFTHEVPDNWLFFVTGIGCGYAGHKPHQIAPMFKDVNPICSFPENWRPYLE